MFLDEGIKYIIQCDVWVLAIKHNMLKYLDQRFLNSKIVVKYKIKKILYSESYKYNII